MPQRTCEVSHFALDSPKHDFCVRQLIFTSHLLEFPYRFKRRVLAEISNGALQSMRSLSQGRRVLFGNSALDSGHHLRKFASENIDQFAQKLGITVDTLQ